MSTIDRNDMMGKETTRTDERTEKRYPVVEVFGPTVQGEGALAGRVTHFVRFGGCDFACAWCDSDHAVLPAKVRKAERLTVPEIRARLMSLKGNPEWITLSGGNPALHDLGKLVSGLHSLGFKVAVETQGSIWKNWLADVNQLTISPKPPSSNMQHNTAKLLPAFMTEVADKVRPLYRRYQSEVCLKVPIFDQIDLDWAKTLHLKYPEVPFYFSVVTRMGGLHGDFDGGIIDTTDNILGRYKWLVESIASDPLLGGTTAFPQLHALVWGHDRGH